MLRGLREEHDITVEKPTDLKKAVDELARGRGGGAKNKTCRVERN